MSWSIDRTNTAATNWWIWRSANITDEASIDIAARGFWISGQRAFFDKGIQPNDPA